MITTFSDFIVLNENLQLADKIYFKTGILNEDDKQEIINITHGDNYTKIIADFYKIEETVIYEKTRKKEVIKPRQVIMYILREDFNISYPSIGEKLGGRDHTTVIHSCEKIKNEVKIDSLLSKEIQEIRSIIG